MRRSVSILSASASVLLALGIAACGGGGNPSVNNNGGGSNSTTANSVAISVNPGPSTAYRLTNGVYVSVEVCAPGTSNCVTVPDVLLDTGSSGLRLLSSTVASLNLANVTSGSQTLGNCVQYLDGSYNWGPVSTADIKMASEVASSVPIQIIAEPGYNFAAAPGGCGGTANNSVDSLLANGILGVSFFPYDCGGACAPGTSFNPGVYYSCSSTGCGLTTVALAQQVQNPVGFFSTDNNGVVITLPSIAAAGEPSVAGTLTFGIGTQSDNALGSAQILTPDNSGNISATFGSVLPSIAFIDSGSSALFFLTSAETGLIACVGDNAGYYCPASTQQFTATNKGTNGTSISTSFSVANADNLLNSANDAFSNLGGIGNDASLGDYFDWGLPFFYGRSVFVAIDGANAAGTTGPYWAY